MSQHKQHSILIARPPKTNAATSAPKRIPPQPAAAAATAGKPAAPGTAPHFLSGPAALAARIFRMFVNPGPHEEAEVRNKT